MDRNIGLQMLNTVFKKDNNRITIEKYIYKYCMDHQQDYYNTIYECIGYYIKHNDIHQLLQDIHDNKILWEYNGYSSYQQKIQEENNFITTPFEVLESVLQCLKCNSFKTISYQKQTRSADEGMTTFVHCVKCGNKWINHN